MARRMRRYKLEPSILGRDPAGPLAPLEGQSPYSTMGAYILEQSIKLQELTDMHNIKVVKIKEMVNASMHYKKA
jgi:hypothetical protein